MPRHSSVTTSSYSRTPWTIQTDGLFRRKVELQMLKDEMSQEAVDSVFNNAARILQHCPDPKGSESEKSTGIVIGKVQSG